MVDIIPFKSMVNVIPFESIVNIDEDDTLTELSFQALVPVRKINFKICKNENRK